MEGLGKRIRAIRGNSSQSEYAQKLGYSLRQVSAWEREEAGPPPEFFAKIGKLYGVESLQYLLLDKAADSTTTVKESGGSYGVDRETRALATELTKHPYICAAVKLALQSNETFVREANALASAMNIPIEGAALVLLMKEKK